MKKGFVWAALSALVFAFYSAAAARQGGGRPTAPPASGGPTRDNPKSPRRSPPRKPATPAAAAAKILHGSLTLKVWPADSAVTLNGRPAGPPDGNGLVRVGALKPGQYVLTVRRQSYRDEQRMLQIESGKDAAVEVVLPALPATLNVIPSEDGAAISVKGIGDFAGRVSNQSIAPGTYAVEVSKPGYEKSTSTVVLRPAETANHRVELRPLPVERALAEAEQHLSVRNYDGAAAVAEVVLRGHPDNPRANLLTGYSHYFSGRHAAAVPFLLKALALNQQVVIPVRHYEKVSSREGLFAGRLTLRPGFIGYQSSEGSGHSFTVPAGRLYELKLEAKNGGRLYAQIGVVGSGNKERKQKLYWHPSAALTNTVAGKTAIECFNCQDELQAMAQLLQRAKQ